MLTLNYGRLWKLLRERSMLKENLRKAAGLTFTAISKLGKNEPVHLTIVLKICTALDCDITDILEIKRVEENK